MTNKSGSGNNNQNLPEALKGIGESVAKSAKEDLLEGVPDEMRKQILNLENRQEEMNSPEEIPSKEATPQKPETGREIQEQTVFSRKEEEVKQEINKLRKQIKTEAKKNPQNQTAREAEKSAEKTLPNPGKYHKNFFENVLNTLKSIGNLENSELWQEMWKTRNVYQQNFKKLGPKYWLSGERRLARQTG